MNNVFILTSENLTKLGSTMGTEYTYDNFTRLFETIDAAKKYAEKDYGGPIKWSRGKNKSNSGDLGYVMYTIEKTKVYE